MSTEHYEEEDFNLEDDDIVIEVTDDTPEGDKGFAPRDKNRKAVEEFVSDEEMEDWPDSAKRRMKKLTWDSKQSQRERREAERQRDAAVEMTQAAMNENHGMRQTISAGEQVLLDQMTKGAESNIANANARLKSAHEEGDVDGIVKANADLVEATQAKLYSKSVKPSQVPEKPQVVQTAPTVHPKVTTWVEDNEWFNKDKRKTRIAMAIDAELQEEGITTMSDPDKYVEELDKRINETLGKAASGAEEEAEHLEPEPPSRKTVVTPARRGVEGRSSGKKHVALTKSQMEVVRRCNLTPKQYAREVLKIQGEG